MNAKELRLSNLFIESKTNTVISIIGLTKEIITFSGNFKNDWQAKPIPLTEEWLVKFGFYKDKLEVGLYHFNDLEIFLPNYFTWKTQFIDNIKYVHQLQNLYFALTNEELILK